MDFSEPVPNYSSTKEGRKKEKNWSHIEWWWSSPFFVKSFSVAFPFNEAFSSPKTSLCLSKSKDCWNFLPARKNLYPKNPTYPKVPISATDCTDFELNLHLWQTCFGWESLWWWRVNKGCVTHCGLAIYICHKVSLRQKKKLKYNSPCKSIIVFKTNPLKQTKVFKIL